MTEEPIKKYIEDSATGWTAETDNGLVWKIYDQTGHFTYSLLDNRKQRLIKPVGQFIRPDDLVALQSITQLVIEEIKRK